MDLKVYYKKIRDVAETILAEFPVIVSKQTADGGREGVMAEVTRQQAARMIAEDRARLATDTEAKAYHAAQQAQRKELIEESQPARFPVTVLSDDDLEALQTARSGRKKNSH
jgi:thiamine monophosphate synthase